MRKDGVSGGARVLPRQWGLLPSALGGSGSTLWASSSRPWPWSVTLSTNLPSTTQLRDLSRPWATPRWCRYLIPWEGVGKEAASALWSSRPLPPAPRTPQPPHTHFDEVQQEGGLEHPVQLYVSLGEEVLEGATRAVLRDHGQHALPGASRAVCCPRQEQPQVKGHVLVPELPELGRESGWALSVLGWVERGRCSVPREYFLKNFSYTVDGPQGLLYGRQALYC